MKSESMKLEDGATEEVGSRKEKGDVSEARSSKSPSSVKTVDVKTEPKRERRDEWTSGSRDTGDDRDSGSSERSEAPKKSTKSSHSRRNKSSSRRGGYPSDNCYHYPKSNGPYGIPGGPHGPAGPFPPPPHYSYPGGGPPDHYRGPPPPHYHQMPPMHHQGPYGGPSGHYGPPPHSMAGHGHYHPGYAPYPGAPPMPYHGHPSYPAHGNMSMGVGGSDSASISSSKSKGSKKSSTSSHKKRTIDGVHDSMQEQPPNLPGAFAFRRTSSNSSSSSTVTAGNNTSLETTTTLEESPHKRERITELPPLSHPSSSNIFDDDMKKAQFHRRDYSGTSTASTLSVGGFSLSSYDGRRLGTIDDMDEDTIMKSSPKRRKGSNSAPLRIDTGRNHRRIPSNSSQSLDAAESSRFQQLTMEDTKPMMETEKSSNLFLTLSTSPINHTPDVDATPISKNTARHGQAGRSLRATSAFKSKKDMMDRHDETPTPPIPSALGETEVVADEHMLNRHLRGQSFTPLPHIGNGGETAGESPSNTQFSGLAPQLSWSIAGDTPSLGDLADWDEDRKKRPDSTTSQGSAVSRDIVISPHSFSMWKEEHESGGRQLKTGGSGEGKDGDSERLTVLTNADMVMADEALSGTTTPLPMLFDHPSAEERENMNKDKHRASSRKGSHNRQHGEPDHIHHMFLTNGGRNHSSSKAHLFWSKHEDTHGPPPMGLPPTPVFAASEFRDDGFSPMHGERHLDFFQCNNMFGHPGDRVRNLRGRMPPGAHLAPMPLHIPPPMSSHHPLTSPMGIGPNGKGGMWSPHHAGMPPMSSPHHMSPMDLSQSKRKCVPLKPPIPSKFQGDIEKTKTAQVPEFTSLVNFPAHMSQKQAVNLPEGMRCCVMCGQACPCSSGNKKKGGKNKDGSLAPRGSNGQEFDKNGGYAIIPTQNKGLCTLCDVNVWVVVANGLEIKWCKGCKNFRPWAAFGDKGLATKCLRCRERQREKYALQKEEKEKARMLAAKNGKNKA